MSFYIRQVEKTRLKREARMRQYDFGLCNAGHQTQDLVLCDIVAAKLGGDTAVTDDQQTGGKIEEFGQFAAY